MTRKTKTEKKPSTKRHLAKTFRKVRILSLATPQVRKQLVDKGNKEIVDCISECCLNILKGNVHLTSKQKSRLEKHKEQLRAVANKRVNVKKKKEIIQKGGFPLTAILAPVASVLGSLLFNRQ